MWENYRVEQDDIQAPEFLKVKALQKMKDSQKDYGRIFRMRPVWGVAFSLLVVVVVAVSWTTLFARDSESVTDLVFERLDGGLRYFTGIRDGDIEQAELRDVESALGVSELYIEGFHLEGVSWMVEEDAVRIQYYFERGDSSISVMINNHTDSVSTNSILNDIPLALYYRVVLLETTFVAELLYDEIYYQIEAEGLTEEEFVDYLQEILSFLN